MNTSYSTKLQNYNICVTDIMALVTYNKNVTVVGEMDFPNGSITTSIVSSLAPKTDSYIKVSYKGY